MPRMKITQVEEVNHGIYVWQMPDNSVVMDEDGNYLSIPSMRGDIRQIQKLKNAARSHGLTEGKPLFFSGHRQVTDEELEEQKSRAELGMVPDPQDLPAMMEYIKEAREMGLA
ncbi:hypothetical protein UFOVP204_17 [uncultured Caudovirales phage]|uniref:Uncharacterized protein n=1 Tax=uncultured Caudovirales phage TaxID=2100421 RepID=A0A6J7WN99_9CAUD|nr:hypothetical protein UFOVP204_17 [uncultured Caudovirales phage]